MKEISVITNKVDWLEIINLALNRQSWGQKYNLYVYGNVTIQIEMESFNFRRNTANFRLECVYPEDKYHSTYYSYTYVDFFMKNYTTEFFGNLIHKRVISLLNSVIEQRTISKAEEIYSEKRYISRDINEELIKTVGLFEDYEQLLAIDYESLSEDLIDAFKETVLNIINKDYRVLIRAYTDTYKTASKEMLQLLENLEKQKEEKENE